MGKFFKEKILRFFMQKCPLFWSKLDIFPVFCEILQNPPLFEKIPQFPILKNLSPLLGQKSHKTGKFPPFGHTETEIQPRPRRFIRIPNDFVSCDPIGQNFVLVGCISQSTLSMTHADFINPTTPLALELGFISFVK